MLNSCMKGTLKVRHVHCTINSTAYVLSIIHESTLCSINRPTLHSIIFHLTIVVQRKTHFLGSSLQVVLSGYFSWGGHQIGPKAYEHISLTSFSKMRVDLAAQVSISYVQNFTQARNQRVGRLSM